MLVSDVNNLFVRVERKWPKVEKSDIFTNLRNIIPLRFHDYYLSGIGWKVCEW